MTTPRQLSDDELSDYLYRAGLHDAHARAMLSMHISFLNTRYNALIKAGGDKLTASLQLLTRAEKAEVRVEELEREAKFCPSPCGHSSQYAYTPDGVGKVIRCYVCELESQRSMNRVLVNEVAGLRRELNKI